jgi:tripartite-type tricarboxylate transporter receptor subunit TctC
MVRRLGRVALLMRLAAALPAAANDYPIKQIRAIASQEPGGLSDVFMRALADQLGPEISGTVVVENRVGASGSIGARDLRRFRTGRLHDLHSQ